MGIVIAFPVPLPAPDWAAIDAAVELWVRELCQHLTQLPPRLRLVR